MHPKSECAIRKGVSVLVLTFNEQANIASCLQTVGWASEIFVVDSFSTDATAEIAESMGAKVYRHAFENCASQWNWALDHLPFSNEWVLVVDADERISQSLTEEIIRTLTNPIQEYSGYYLKFRFWFMGRWLKHGGLHSAWILRLFKPSAGRFGRHGTSERLILHGRAGYLHTPFDHHDCKPLSDWIQKHIRYAELEAEEYVQERLGNGYRDAIPARFWGAPVERGRWIKVRLWNRLPLLVRPFLFFWYNYLLRGGFLDGASGFVYHVLWSFWYRFLIDAKILEKRRRTQVGESRRAPEDLTGVELSKVTEDPAGFKNGKTERDSSRRPDQSA